MTKHTPDYFFQTISAYRAQIKLITSKFPSQESAILIEQASIDLDHFIQNYQQLLKAQQKFERYMEGINLSFSPEQTGLASITKSPSFGEWTSLLGKT
jgi:hypothetical protein